MILSAAEGNQLLVPRGFLHGFLTLEPETEVQYKVDACHDRGCDGAVARDGPEIGVGWPPSAAGLEVPALSGKDAAARRLANVGAPFANRPQGA